MMLSWCEYDYLMTNILRVWQNFLFWKWIFSKNSKPVMVKTWCNSKELKRESRNTKYFEKAITQSFSQKYDIDKQKQVFWFAKSSFLFSYSANSFFSKTYAYVVASKIFLQWSHGKMISLCFYQRMVCLLWYVWIWTYYILSCYFNYQQLLCTIVLGTCWLHKKLNLILHNLFDRNLVWVIWN